MKNFQTLDVLECRGCNDCISGNPWPLYPFDPDDHLKCGGSSPHHLVLGQEDKPTMDEGAGTHPYDRKSFLEISNLLERPKLCKGRVSNKVEYYIGVMSLLRLGVHVDLGHPELLSLKLKKLENGSRILEGFLFRFWVERKDGEGGEHSKQMGKKLVQQWSPLVVEDTLKFSGTVTIATASETQKIARVDIQSQTMGEPAPKWSNRMAAKDMNLNYVASNVKESPTIAAIERYLATHMNNVSKPKVYYHNDDYFLVKFASMDDHNELLYSGPHILNNRPIILKAWSVDFELNKEDRVQLREDLRLVMAKTQMPTLFGRDYSWTNGHTYSRIDHAVVNAEWIVHMSMLEVVILPPGISDHSPLSLELGGEIRSSSNTFRFFNCLAEHPEFLSKVTEAWKVEHRSGLKQIWQNLSRVNVKLKQLNNFEFKNVKAKVEDLRNQLNKVQEEMYDHISAELYMQEE
ncbi:hypothetical protein BC332_25096 [Capsicum chinense]|nr:hypothetical protein BC332_25096 [Capsicum chinense]